MGRDGDADGMVVLDGEEAVRKRTHWQVGSTATRGGGQQQGLVTAWVAPAR